MAKNKKIKAQRLNQGQGKQFVQDMQKGIFSRATLNQLYIKKMRELTEGKQDKENNG